MTKKAIVLLMLVPLIMIGCVSYPESQSGYNTIVTIATLPPTVPIESDPTQEAHCSTEGLSVEEPTDTTYLPIEQPVETAPPLGRYESIVLSAEELDVFAKVLWLEAGAEPFDGQQAAAEVVLNRILSTYFPNSFYGVIYEEGQFTTIKYIDGASPTYVQYDAINAALNGPNILPLEVVFFSQTGENDNVWGTIGGHVFCYPYTWEEEDA